VLSTLHTSDAPSAITRLRDLQIPNFLILSTVIGVLAQRLVRVNCAHCSEDYAPTEDDAVALGLSLERLKEFRLRRGTGCLHCRQTGFAGRDGIFQIMPLTEKLRRLVAQQAASPDIVEAARAEGMRTLREAAIEKVLEGVTTVAEMLRVAGR